MKNMLTLALVMALPIGLAGCDKKPESPTVEAPTAAATAAAMPSMEMPVGSKMGQGSGTVTAIDAANGKITLDHGTIPSVGWPAMKMGFSAKPSVLTGIALGDKVEFDVTITGSAGEVTRIKKR